MNKPLYIVFLMSVLLLSSCEKKMGELLYEGIYILENGKSKDAHGYILDCSSKGWKYELEIISDGITSVIPYETYEEFDDPPEWLLIKDKPDYPPTHEEAYQHGSGNAPQYLQKVIIELLPNNGAKKRKAKILIVSREFFHCAAEITIRQAGK